MTILGITLVFVLCAFKATNGDGSLQQPTATINGLESVSHPPFEFINNTAVLPQLLMLWNEMYATVNNVPLLLDVLIRRAEMMYESYKDDLLHRLQNITQMTGKTARHPKLISRTHAHGFNRTCFEQNKSILMKKIEDYYNQTIKNSCLRDIDLTVYYIKICRMPEWKLMLEKIEATRNSTEDIKALEFFMIRNALLRFTRKPNLGPDQKGILELLEQLGTRLNTVNDLLVQYVSTRRSLMDCQQEYGIEIDPRKKDQIHQEIEKSMLWMQSGEEQSRSCESIVPVPDSHVRITFRTKHKVSITSSASDPHTRE